MLLPPIVAIVVPAEATPDLAAATLRACNLALGPTRCVLADGPDGSQGNAWIGSVKLEPEQAGLFRVELRDAIPRTPRTSFTRTLTFEGTEAPPHRWSTAGVVVAALVISAESARSAETADNGSAGSAGGSPGKSGPDNGASVDVSSDLERRTTEPDRSHPRNVSDANRDVAATPKTKTAPNASAAATSRHSAGSASGTGNALAFRLDASALIANGLQNSALRRGARLAPSVALGSALNAWSSFSITGSEDLVKAFWLSGAVGLGFATTDRGGFYGVEARLGLRGDRIDFRTSSGTVTDSNSKFRAGGVAGIDLTLALSKPVALLLGGEAGVMAPSVLVKRAGSEFGRLTTLDGSLFLGLRFRLGHAAE